MKRRAVTERISKHAIDRYREFYPRAGQEELEKNLLHSIEIDTSVGLRLVGRGWQSEKHRGTYRLHPERTGIFVIDNNTVISFLRFYSLNQYELAIKLYGVNREPTATAAWVKKEEEPSVVSRWIDGLTDDEVHIHPDVKMEFDTKVVRIALWKEPTEDELWDLTATIEELPVSPAGVAELKEKTVCLYRYGLKDARIMLPGGTWVDEAPVKTKPTETVKIQSVAVPEAVKPDFSPVETVTELKDKVGQNGISWLDGTEARSIRIARTLVNQMGTCRRAIRWWLRGYLLGLPYPAKQDRDTYSFSYKVPIKVPDGQRVEAWLFKRNGGGEKTEWWLSSSPPYAPSSEELEAMRLLASKGWDVFSPLPAE